MLFYRYLHTLTSNLRHNHWAALSCESGGAAHCLCAAESLTIGGKEVNSFGGVEAGDGDEAGGGLDDHTAGLGGVIFFYFCSFESLECSESAPRLCRFVSVDCGFWYMESSIFNICIFESISSCRWYCWSPLSAWVFIYCLIMCVYLSVTSACFSHSPRSVYGPQLHTLTIRIELAFHREKCC